MEEQVIVGVITLIIIGFIIYNNYSSSSVWTLFTQTAPFQPFEQFSGISLAQCQNRGYEWIKNQILDAEYSCCRKCKVQEGSLFYECGECYAYNKNGLRYHDEGIIPAF